METIKQQLALEKVRNEEDLKTDENTLKTKAPHDGEDDNHGALRGRDLRTSSRTRAT